jgi:hypothetical protein
MTEEALGREAVITGRPTIVNQPHGRFEHRRE